MNSNDDEEELLRSVTLQNAKSILLARLEAERKLIESNRALEQKTKELAYSLSLMQATLESTTDGILVTDEEGRVKSYNNRFLSMWRFTTSDMVQAQHSQLLEMVSDQLQETQFFKARIDSIYEASPQESYDILEFVDGRSYERFSSIQVVGGKNVGRVWSFRDISMKKQNEEALRRSEEFSRTIIESSRDCIKILSLNGLLIWMSESGQKLFGLKTINHLLGRPWTEMWVSSDRETAQATVKLAAQGKVAHFVGHILQEGEPRWMDVVVSPFLDSSGKPEKLLAVTRDVTERRLAEDELRRSEIRFRQLADSMPQIVWSARPDGVIDYYNYRWFEYTGVPPEQAASFRDFESVLHPKDLERCIDGWSAALTSGDDFQLEFRLRGASGSYRWHLSRARPVRNDQGEVIRWFGSSTDIHDHKSTEEALRDETRILELLNQTGIALSSTLDLPDLTQIITDAATELSGSQLGAFFQVIHGDNRDTLQLHSVSRISFQDFLPLADSFSALLSGPIFHSEGPKRWSRVDAEMGFHQLRNNEYRISSTLAIPVVSPSGAIQGGLIFSHSDTDFFTERTEHILLSVAAQAAIAIENANLYENLKQASLERERLLEAERASRGEAERINLMKDEFLATLSHELRTPMNAIQGWSEILNTEDLPAHDLKMGLESIWRNAKAQTQIIEDLLDMSRIISGKVRLEVEQVELSALIESAMEALQFSAKAKGIALIKNMEQLPDGFAGDPNRLRQVIWNLLSNSLKFTPKGGQVEVSLKKQQDQLEIQVKDTGTGIKAEFLPYVFDRFRQADSTLSRKYGGLGLGLAIVKQLVEIHGGSVRAESAGEGLGATFTVSLPAIKVGHQDQGTPSIHSSPSPDLIDLSGIKVLVIDDERDALELIARVLKQFRADVSIASSAAEGREILLSQKPDVIVSDIGMPEKDGYQFIREVRRLSTSNGGSTPAIALTAFARTEDRVQAMNAGYQEHITKPVELQKLATTIGSLARRK